MATATDIDISGSYPTPLPDLGESNNFGADAVLLDLPTLEEIDPVLGLVVFYKMRGQDSGAPAPGYVTWIADFPDFLGTQSSTAQPPIVGSLIPGSVVEISHWFP